MVRRRAQARSRSSRHRYMRSANGNAIPDPITLPWRGAETIDISPTSESTLRYVAPQLLEGVGEVTRPTTDVEHDRTVERRCSDRRAPQRLVPARRRTGLGSDCSTKNARNSRIDRRNVARQRGGTREGRRHRTTISDIPNRRTRLLLVGSVRVVLEGRVVGAPAVATCRLLELARHCQPRRRRFGGVRRTHRPGAGVDGSPGHDRLRCPRPGTRRRGQGRRPVRPSRQQG